jgi:predicted Zn-dependent protease
VRYLQAPLGYPLALSIVIAVTAVVVPSTLNAQGESLLQNAVPGSCMCADGTPADEERDSAHAMGLEVLRRSQPWGGKRLNEYIEQLGQRLASASGARRPFRFQVLYFSGVNARSFSGEYILLTTGAITAAHSEAELAAILAHEIAHLNLDRCQSQAKKPPPRLTFRALAFLSGSTTANPRGTAGSRLAQARLRQQEENEADDLTVIYVAKAGYDPKAAASLLGRLDELDTQTGTESDDWPFARHSSTGRCLRAERLAARLATAQTVTENTPEFEAARAEVLHYDEIYALATGESPPEQPRQPPKLVRRAGDGR